MTKLLSKLFKSNKNIKKEGRFMSPEEKYIMARNPQSILDVENYSRDYERKHSASFHRSSWSIL